MKPFTNDVLALMRKDFRQIWSSLGSRIAIASFLAVFAAALPALFLILVYASPLESIGEIKNFILFFCGTASWMSIRQSLFYIVTEQVYPVFFLILSVLLSALCAAQVFFGEREARTLDTLLLSPMPVTRIRNTKYLFSCLYSFTLSLLSFLLIAAVSCLGDISLVLPLFFGGHWALCLFVLSPALCIFSVSLIAFLSQQMEKRFEAVSAGAVTLLPVLLLFLLQFTGWYRLGAIVLLIFSGIYLIGAIFLFLFGRKRLFRA